MRAFPLARASTRGQRSASPASPWKAALLLGGVALSHPVMAQPIDQRPDDVAALRGEVQAQNDRIERLEALIEQQAAVIGQLRQELLARSPAPGAAPTAAFAKPLPDGDRSAPAIPNLDVFGDARVRQELNLSDRLGRDRGRTVIRGRIGATYQASPNFAVGARLVTGDPDDPNTADVTLGSFADDLPVALDQLWMRYKSGGLTAYAGKFPQILARTDMVWDGDVMPQGVGLAYRAEAMPGLVVGANGLHFVIDEAAGGPDSHMTGMQLTSAAALGERIKLDVAAAYYHYTLSELGSADAGDFRGNRVANGRYLSDFRLVDLIGRLGITGLGEAWPAALTVNFVRNLGARDSEDTGFLIGGSLGRQKQRGDWHIAYDYSQVEADAVFAAFSHDNIAISTNYELYGLTVENRLAPGLAASLNWYHYRPLRARLAGSFLPNDWLDRFRLNLMYEF